MAGVSRFSDNGLALPSRPSSSQKKKRRSRLQQQQWSYVVRKSVTLSRKKKRSSSPGVEEAMRVYRSQLRPLLDAIRFVESSNRVDCPDGDGGASIGPLQISEHYHLDAWKNNKRTRASWLRCRDLDHAENTVVAYWMRYCSEALTQHDWEFLAKIHNGGPRGPQRPKTSYYWSKVCRYLEENQTSIPTESPVKPEHPSSSNFTNLERRIEYKLKHGLKTLAAERRMPIVNRQCKLQIRRVPFADISSSTLNISQSSSRLRNLLIDDLSIQRLGLEYDCENSNSRVQLEIESENQPLEDPDQGFTTPLPIKSKQAANDEQEENVPEWRRSSIHSRNLDILYSSELSEQKEEEIFTELARLLPSDLSECVDRKEDESFEFPPVPIQADYTTPVLRSNSRSIQLVTEIDAASTAEAQASGSIEFDATGSILLREEPDQPDPEDKNLLSELADLLELPHPATPIQQGNQTRFDDLDTAKLSLADFLLEIPDPSASIEYVKALFSCEEMLLDKLCDRDENIFEESFDSSNPTPAPTPAASIGTRQSRIGANSSSGECTCHSSGNRLASSLRKLCSVWEEQDVDLLTRSLRFRMLTTSGEKDAPCIAWEIEALRSIDRNAKSRKSAKDLIQQQRDKIYMNIGAYASRTERLQLYSAWGVRKLSTGRLKKIVYDLLWRDPKRYAHSAELVGLYL